MDNRGVIHGFADVGDIASYIGVLKRAIPQKVQDAMSKPISFSSELEDSPQPTTARELVWHLMKDLTSGKARIDEISEIMDLINDEEDLMED